jgi:hypothetical protein
MSDEVNVQECRKLVYQSISLVSAELAHEGISKDRSNQQQGYKFRGIDDCLNALAPLLSRSNLVILPEVLERDVVERQTKSGGALFYVTVKVKYAFVNSEDGSRHDVVTYGEAMDSADKATNKAMSAAYKYAVIQAFCIPTEGENDADAVTHDVAAKRAQVYTQQKQTAQAKIAELREQGLPRTEEEGDGLDQLLGKSTFARMQGPDAAAPSSGWRLPNAAWMKPDCGKSAAELDDATLTKYVTYYEGKLKNDPNSRYRGEWDEALRALVDEAMSREQAAPTLL